MTPVERDAAFREHCRNLDSVWWAVHVETCRREYAEECEYGEFVDLGGEGG